MLDDIAPHAFDNQYDPALRPEPCSPALYWDDAGLYMLDDRGALSVPVRAAYDDAAAFHHLFSLDGQPWFLMDRQPRDARRAIALRALRLRADVPQHLLLALSVAAHLARWYRESRHCGACGARASHSPLERAMVCPACGLMRYPSIAPAVIVAVTRGDTLLLARGTHYGGGYHSLIAGYVEAGERAERAACREVYEETGLRVSRVHYFGSQPWPFSGALMIGFFAEAEPDAPLRLQKEELADAAFYRADALPTVALRVSIAGAMIEAFQKGERPHGGAWAV